MRMARMQTVSPLIPMTTLSRTDAFLSCSSFSRATHVFKHVYESHVFCDGVVPKHCVWGGPEGMGPGCLSERPQLSLLTHLQVKSEPSPLFVTNALFAGFPLQSQHFAAGSLKKATVRCHGHQSARDSSSGTTSSSRIRAKCCPFGHQETELHRKSIVI